MKIVSTKPYFEPRSIDRILASFKQILEGESFLTMGKFCRQFEDQFAVYTGTKHAISVSCGTGALEIILNTLGVKGCDVIVPTNTFAATAFAVIRAGGNPVFADCGSDMTLDPKDLKSKLTNKCKAVITVHIGGLISPYTCEIADICRDRDIYLVEDACHAHGSMLNGGKAGTFGIAGAFSFFSTKVMTTGEGGMIVTNDEDIYRKSLVLRDQSKVAKGNYQNYHEEIGYNWRMPEVEALMGIAQLEMLDRFLERRNEIARIYDRELDGYENLELMRVPSGIRHNYYKYTAFLKNTNRDILYKDMKEKYDVSLGGFVYEIPLHLQPALSQYKNSDLPVAEDLCLRHICLPLYFTMTDEEALYTADSLRKTIKDISHPA
jgi:dTDP-4-amino-4,6-dideoxygalactose transaminase